MTKHIIFYSNFCNHCQDLLTDIIKKGIRKKFVLICVEKHKDKLPHFVNRVPFIIDANGIQILEHNMSHFLDSLNEKDEYDDISAFVSCAKGHFGNEFCYIDDIPPKNDVASTLGYVFIDEDDKYQGSEQDMLVNQRKNDKGSTNQMLQRDLYEYSPSIPDGPPLNSTITNGQSILPLHLQAQDPRLATLPPQYQQIGGGGQLAGGGQLGGGGELGRGQSMSYNSLDLQEQPALPFQQIKVERQKKINDNMVEDLVQQRMNDLKAFM